MRVQHDKFSITQELPRFTRGSLNNSDEQGLTELEVCLVCFLNPAPKGIWNNPVCDLKGFDQSWLSTPFVPCSRDC